MFNYFIHPSGLSKMDAVLKMRMTEGAAGYGIYMQLLELLRDAPDYAMQYDPTVLAWSLHEPDQTKLEAVCRNYGLFELSEDGRISSPWLRSIMSEHDAKRAKLSAAGKRSAATRATRAEQAEPTPEQGSNEVATRLQPPPQPGCNVVDLKKQQTKQTKPKSNKQKNPSNPNSGVSGGGILSEDDIKRIGRDKSGPWSVEDATAAIPSDSKHNPRPLIAAIVTYSLTRGQVEALAELTHGCEVGSREFMSLLAALRHCQETQFKPAYPFEYFISRVQESALS